MKVMPKVCRMGSLVLLFIFLFHYPAMAENIIRRIVVTGAELGGEESDDTAQKLEQIVRERLTQKITLQAGENCYEFTAEELGLTWTNPELASEILEAKAKGKVFFRLQKFEVTYDVNPDIIIAQLSNIINAETIQPVNGTVSRVNDEFIITDGEEGRSYSLEGIMGDVVRILLENEQNEALFYEFPFIRVLPQISSQSIEFSDKPLGEYTTRNLGSTERENNILLSAAGINGTLVLPGESFSALEMYGPVTAEYGYQPAPVYNGGRQLTGIGGGICQTTTTLYNACLLAELDIVYRRQHSMLVNYVPPSLDAMVDYDSKSDFIAANNTNALIYLEAFTGIDEDNSSYVTIRIWGRETRPENRTVEYDYDILACQYQYPLIKENIVNDDYCTVGLVTPDQKIYAEVEPHPFVQSRAYKVVKVDGEVESVEALPGTYGDYDQYRPMGGVIYHASDCLVDAWTVEDEDTWLGVRPHYQVMFKNGDAWNHEDPLQVYTP